MQGMRVLSESEGISYQTPILKITKLIWRWKSENQIFLAKILPKISFFSSKFRKYQLIIFLREPKLKKKIPPFLSNIYAHSYNLMVFAEICVDNTKKALLLKYPRRLMKFFIYKICKDLVNRKGYRVRHQCSCKLLKKLYMQ